MKIPVDVEVYCVDGLVGRSITTILTPTKKISHLVVAEKKAPGIKRLVPLALVKKMTPRLIILDCTKEVLLNMDRLTKFLINPIDLQITAVVMQ
jgi:hypothetical protein